MPRSDARQLSFDFYPRRAPHSLVPHEDPEGPRRRRLEARRLRLRGNVAALKAELDRLNSEAEEVVRRAASLIDPLRERMQGALTKALGWFERLLGEESELGRIERRAVSKLFEQVSQTLLDKLDDLPDLESNQAPKKPRGKAPRAEEGSLGALFKQLAVAFHPDRGTDEDDRARRHVIMREITEAYAQDDAARLLELQEQLRPGRSLELDGAAATVPSPARHRLVRLSASNRALERQRRRLERYLVTLRRRPWGKLDGAGDFLPSEALKRVVEQSERVIDSLSRVEKTLRRFAQGKLSITALLRAVDPNG